MEKQEIQELFNKYATDLAPDFETETMNICDFTKFLEDNSIPMQLPVKVNFAEVNEVIDELIEKNLNKERWQMRPDNWREFVGYEKALKELKTILSKISA